MTSAQRAIRKLQRFGTNYDEFSVGESVYCTAVVTGHRIGFFLRNNSTTISAIVHFDDKRKILSLSGKSLTGTIKWCYANPKQPPEPVKAFSLAGKRPIFLEL